MKTAIEHPERIMIVSPANSGSTLLAMLLATHPDIATVGETSGLTFQVPDVNAYRCSCGAPILACEFWKTIEEKIKQNYPPFSIQNFGSNYRTPESPVIDWLLQKQYHGGLFETALRTVLAVSPEWRRRRANIDRVNAGLIDAVLSVSGKSVFLDSSKNPERIRWLAEMAIPTKYIHLKRDGRGVTLSYQRNYGISLDQAVMTWKKTVKYCEAFLADQPKDSWIPMRYEDLCANPLDEVNRVLRFCGIPEMEKIGSFRDGEIHVIGNEMRLRSQNIIKLDERWHKEYTPEILAEFERQGGAVNQRLGYQPVRQ
jgi:hypothetical protein